MKRDWPVGETWRASFLLGLLPAAATARADPRALVVEARTQDPARLEAWRATLSGGAMAAERAAAAFVLGQLGAAWEAPSEQTRAQDEAGRSPRRRSRWCATG